MENAMNWINFLDLLPVIAKDPITMVGYIALLGGWILWLFRKRRSRDFLKTLNSIPENKRANFAREAGYSYDELSQLPPDDRVKLLTKRYRLIAYIMAVFAVIIICSNVIKVLENGITKENVSDIIDQTLKLHSKETSEKSSKEIEKLKKQLKLALVAAEKSQHSSYKDTQSLLRSLVDQEADIDDIIEYFLSSRDDKQDDFISKSLAIANIAYFFGRLKKAKLIVDDILIKEPDNLLALQLMAVILKTGGDFASSEQYILRAARIAQEQNDLIAESNSLAILGAVKLARGDFFHAKEYLKKSEKIYQDVGITIKSAEILTNLGVIYAREGRVNEAEEKFLQAIKIEEENGNQIGMAQDYTNLGNIYWHRKDYEKAEEYYQKAAAINRKFNRLEGLAKILNNIGTIYKDTQHFDEAIKKYEEAFKLNEQLERQQGMAMNLANLAGIYGQLGNVKAAKKYYSQCLTIHKEIHDVYGEALDYQDLGTLAYQEKDYSEARRLWEQAHKLFVDQHLKNQAAHVMQLLVKLPPES